MVEISKTVGKVENSNTFLVKRVISKMFIPMVKLTMIKKSKTKAGNGIMIKPIIPTTINDTKISDVFMALFCFLVAPSFIVFSPFLFVKFYVYFFVLVGKPSQ